MFGGNYNSASSTFSGSQIGGGYMNEENNFNASNKMYGGGGSAQSRAAVIPYDQRKLSQVTIKQIKTAKPPQPDENLVIDGVEVTQLCMIAQIQSIDVQSSHTTLTISDLTGTLEAKQWTNSEDPQSMKQTVELIEGRWIRIFGKINHFNGRCSINVFEIFPIIDYNEVTHHFLECICSHLTNSTGYNAQSNNANQNTDKMNNQAFNHNDGSNNMYNGNGNAMVNQGWNQNDSNLSPLENQILNVMKQPQFENNEQGCPVDVVFQRMPNEDINNIREAISSLADAGMIYSTTDEEHYKYSGDTH